MKKPKKPPKKPPDLFDHAAAEAAKQAGMEQAENNSGDWTPRAFARAVDWCRRNAGAEVIGEDIRRALSEAGLEEPPNHSNAWGAMIKSVYQAGWIHPTGAYRKPASVKSKGRPCQVYLVRG